MGLFSSSKGASGNSGTASNGRFTLTKTSGRKPSGRMEWTAPRTGDGTYGAKSRRPKQ